MPDDKKKPQSPVLPQPQLIELPIVVEQAYNSYTQVAEALDQLNIAVNYMPAAQLASAVFSDDRVAAVLNTRSNALFGLPMDFKYPGQDEPTDDTPAEALELKERIRDIVETEWEDILPGAAAREWFRWGVMMNLGVGELVWKWHESDEPDGLQIPTLKVWHTMWVFWVWSYRANFLIHAEGVTQLTPGDGHWVTFSPFGHNHGWMYGAIQSLGWLYLDRVFLKKQWARANEKFSLGVVKAYMPSEASDEDKQRFAQATQNMPHEATINLPVSKDGIKFDLEMLKTDVATGWETFLQTKRSIDTDIAVCLLGQNLSTEISSGSGGSGGSKAAAKVHNDIREDILKADVEILSSTIKTQILAPLVERNWGHVIRAMGQNVQDFVPNVTWQIEPPEDKAQDTAAIQALAAALPVLAQAGADVGALLERFDIPMLEGKQRRTRPPPDGDLNERPGLPAAWDGIVRSEAAELEPTALSRSHLAGASLRGQLAVDELVEGLRDDLKRKLAPTVKELSKILASSTTYQERRKRILDLYRDWDPSDVRVVLERSLIAAQLIGRVTGAKARA